MKKKNIVFMVLSKLTQMTVANSNRYMKLFYKEKGSYLCMTYLSKEMIQ